MRKLFLMVALCLVGALAFAPAAMAQDPCPDPDFPRQTPDGCQASDLPDVVPGTSATATADASATASASASTSASANAAAGDVDCAGFASQFGAQQFFDSNNPAADPHNLDADDDGLACEENAGGGAEDDSTTSTATAEADDDSASASASASQDVEDLPETGGASVLALGMGALLVAGGLLSLRIVR